MERAIMAEIKATEMGGKKKWKMKGEMMKGEEERRKRKKDGEK